MINIDHCLTVKPCMEKVGNTATTYLRTIPECVAEFRVVLDSNWVDDATNLKKIRLKG